MYEVQRLKELEAQSDCTRRKVGAIIIDRANEIIGSGYNKIIDYEDSCGRCGCKREFCKKGEKLNECDAIHAEIMALEDIWYKNYRITSHYMSNCKMYVSTFPCHECAKAIVNSGIKTLIYLEDYPSMDNDLRMLKDNGITVIKMQID